MRDVLLHLCKSCIAKKNWRKLVQCVGLPQYHIVPLDQPFRKSIGSGSLSTGPLNKFKLLEQILVHLLNVKFFLISLLYSGPILELVWIFAGPKTPSKTYVFFLLKNLPGNLHGFYHHIFFGISTHPEKAQQSIFAIFISV